MCSEKKTAYPDACAGPGCFCAVIPSSIIVQYSHRRSVSLLRPTLASVAVLCIQYRRPTSGAHPTVRSSEESSMSCLFRPWLTISRNPVHPNRCTALCILLPAPPSTSQPAVKVKSSKRYNLECADLSVCLWKCLNPG